MLRAISTAAVLALIASDPTSAADDGLELSFNDHCRECHSFAKDDNRLGPSLYGIVGRKAGAEPGFAFTDSLKSSGITWNEAVLDKWIENPQAVIPGNGMSPPYGGVADPAIRAKIIAFLQSISPKEGSAGEQ